MPFKVKATSISKHVPSKIILRIPYLPSDKAWQSPFEWLLSPESIALRSDKLPAMARADLGEFFLFVATKTFEAFMNMVKYHITHYIVRETSNPHHMWMVFCLQCPKQ